MGDNLVLEEEQHNPEHNDERDDRHVDVAERLLLLGALQHNPGLWLARFAAVFQKLRPGVFEVLNKLVVGLVAVVRVLGQRAVDHVGGRPGDIRRKCLQADGIALEMLERNQRRVLRLKRRPARQRMEERPAQAVNVASEILGIMVQLFRGDIIRRPPDFPAGFFLRLFQRQGETEVHDLGRVRVGKKDVARLHVAVNQARLVGGVQTRRNLGSDLQHLRLGDAALQVHQVIERTLVHQLHRDVILSVVASERKDLHHVGMIHRSRDLRLRLQFFDVVLIRAELPAQQLERDDAVQVHVPRPVNRSHAAGSDRLCQLEVIEARPHPH